VPLAYVESVRPLDNDTDTPTKTRVEPVNSSRQTFDRADVGRFKAQVLAERLARRFGHDVGYSVAPYDSRVHTAAFDAPSRLGVPLSLRLTAGTPGTAGGLLNLRLL